MSKTRSKQVSEEWGNRSNVSKTIVKQSIEVSLVYFSNGPMVVSSPMSKTRSKLGSEGKCWYCSNLSNTIEKQGIKGNLEYFDKGPIRVSSPMSKTRSKQDIDGNVSIVSMFLKQLRSKTLKEVWDMAPICK